MPKLQRIGILFFVRLQAMVFAVIGLVAGILYSFGGFFYELVTNSLNSGTALAFLALVGMPLLFGLAGAVAGIVEALVYNALSRKFGGIDIDMTVS